MGSPFASGYGRRLHSSGKPRLRPQWSPLQIKRREENGLKEEAGGSFQVGLDLVDELGCLCAVDYPVVGGDCALHYVGNGNLAVPDNRLLGNASHRYAGALERIDDGDEAVDLEHGRDY